MSRRAWIILGAVLALAVVASSAFFVLPQTRIALVLQFGELKRVDSEPGLKAKWPWQSVLFYDRRLTPIDPDPQQVLFKDNLRLDVDAYGVYRITDPLLFYQTVNTTAGLQPRLSSIINSSIRRVLGATQLNDILTGERDKVMAEIRDEVYSAAKRFGVDVVDVRLRRADFPTTTSAAIYERMRSERDREAKQLRAEGTRDAQVIKSEAERERTILLATAEKEAQILRGEGDASALKIFSDAFGQDQRFFAFFRSLQAYREAFAQGDTPIVLSTDNEFLRFFNTPSGVRLPAGGETKQPGKP